MQPGRERPVDPPSGVDCRAFDVRQTLGARQRLRRPSQFQAAYDQNRRWHGRYMVLFLHQAPDAALRLGVVASKRVGNAVARARAKRRLREAFRRNRAAFSLGLDDVVLVARRPILSAPWREVVADLMRLASQAGILPPPGGR